jgi:hypothetical protein
MSKNTQLASLINYISVDGSGNVILSSGQIIATQNYVATAVSNLVASAPSTLDTLNELATALGNDANFATTVTNSIATKLPLSGGTLTGTLYGTEATFSSDLFALMGVFTRNSADTFIGSSNNTSGITVNGTTLVTKIVSGGNTVATFANNGSATFTNSITANRFYGTYSSVLNTHTTVNPSSNVLLMSGPNDRDAWVYLDQADTSSNWGIYHRQIDSAVGLLEANSIGFIGGGASALKAFIGLNTGNGYFSGSMGIGTATPSNLLHVNGGGDYNTMFSSSSNRSGWVIATPGTTTPGGSALVLASDNSFRFGNASQYQMAMYTNNEVGIWGGGVERLRVLNGGQVIRPFQPSFMAYSGGVSISGGTWQIISNNITTEAYDIGSNYSGGRFTAPVAGRYYFFFGGWTTINSNGERYAVSFVVNSGSTYFIAGGNYCLTDSPLAGASIVHNLNAGDYVELHCFSAVSGTWGGGHAVWWGGYLL